MLSLPRLPPKRHSSFDFTALSPKSIVRMMIEEAMTFSEFISRYDLARSEGVVLRYLTDTYRALRQTVPYEFRTDEVEAIIDWLGRLVRSIDSSLLDEWEALADGRVTLDELDLLADDDATSGEEAAFGADEDGNVAFTRNKHALRKAIRNAMFRRIEALDRDDYDLLDRLDGADGWDGDRWADAMDPYWDVYATLGTSMDSRSDRFFSILEDPSYADLLQAGADEETASSWLEGHKQGRLWLAIQILDDEGSAEPPSGEAEMTWAIWAVVDLDASDEADELVMHMIKLGER